MYTDTHTSPQTSLSLSLTHHSLQSQFPSRSSVTRQLSPGLRTPYEIIPMPTLPLWFPWQPGTEQWSCQVTEGQVIGECVCVCACQRVDVHTCDGVVCLCSRVCFSFGVTVITGIPIRFRLPCENSRNAAVTSSICSENCDSYMTLRVCMCVFSIIPISSCSSLNTVYAAKILLFILYYSETKPYNCTLIIPTRSSYDTL